MRPPLVNLLAAPQAGSCDERRHNRTGNDDRANCGADHTGELPRSITDKPRTQDRREDRPQGNERFNVVPELLS